MTSNNISLNSFVVISNQFICDFLTSSLLQLKVDRLSQSQQTCTYVGP